MSAPSCRFCGASLDHIVLDLGEQPLANSFLKASDLARPEAKFRLCVRVCDTCLLVQTDTTVPPESIFSDYVYFSSYSNAWLAHAKAYSDAMIQRFALGPQSRVIEVASNDGYLLKNFVECGIPCLGIEPAENVAAVARAAGVPTETQFLGKDTARRIVARGGAADLVAANNVLAHVPAINDFVAGLRELLADNGVLTVECPHLLRLIAEVQFDTIYHEHFFYFSLAAIELVFAKHGLRLFDVEQLSTHGGSLRVFAERADAKSPRAVSEKLDELRALEREAGVHRPDYYDGFNRRVTATIASVRNFLAQAHRELKTVVAYGAAAKGNTLLNACGATAADIAYAVDRNPHKQGLLLPGTHLPVYAPERIAETRPDYVLILPWNLKEEIVQQTKYIADWGGRFAVPIPELRVFAA
ncbi:MAG TPA: class I SAM-dependent methyltransferase, partial [Micropepsaceae bacterium]